MEEKKPLYVEKARYDRLLRSLMLAKEDRKRTEAALTLLYASLQDVDDRVLDDIHQFHTLKEQQACFTGAVNAMTAIRWKLDEIREELTNAEACSKQD